jgi:hypothetical protein
MVSDTGVHHSFPVLFIICSVLITFFSSKDYVALNERLTVNDELEMIWKETVVA